MAAPNANSPFSLVTRHTYNIIRITRQGYSFKRLSLWSRGRRQLLNVLHVSRLSYESKQNTYCTVMQRDPCGADQAHSKSLGIFSGNRVAFLRCSTLRSVNVTTCTWTPSIIRLPTLCDRVRLIPARLRVLEFHLYLCTSTTHGVRFYNNYSLYDPVVAQTEKPLKTS